MVTTDIADEFIENLAKQNVEEYNEIDEQQITNTTDVCSLGYQYSLLDLIEDSLKEYKQTSFVGKPILKISEGKKKDYYISDVEGPQAHTRPHIHYNANFAGFPTGSKDKIILNNIQNERGTNVLYHKINAWITAVNSAVLEENARCHWYLFLNIILNNIANCSNLYQQLYTLNNATCTITDSSIEPETVTFNGREFATKSIEDKIIEIGTIFSKIYSDGQTTTCSDIVDLLNQLNKIITKNIQTMHRIDIYDKNNCPRIYFEDNILLNKKLVTIYLQLYTFLQGGDLNQNIYNIRKFYNTICRETTKIIRMHLSKHHPDILTKIKQKQTKKITTQSKKGITQTRKKIMSELIDTPGKPVFGTYTFTKPGKIKDFNSINDSLAVLNSMTSKSPCSIKVTSTGSASVDEDTTRYNLLITGYNSGMGVVKETVTLTNTEREALITKIEKIEGYDFAAARGKHKKQYTKKYKKYKKHKKQYTKKYKNKNMKIKKNTYKLKNMRFI